jgi:hypothetical protein
MKPVPPLLGKAEFFHGGVGRAREPRLDEVEVVGLVGVVGIDRDDAASRENDAHAVSFERRAHQRCQLLDAEVLADFAHSGLPVRRGLRRPAK